MADFVEKLCGSAWTASVGGIFQDFRLRHRRGHDPHGSHRWPGDDWLWRILAIGEQENWGNQLPPIRSPRIMNETPYRPTTGRGGRWSSPCLRGRISRRHSGSLSSPQPLRCVFEGAAKKPDTILDATVSKHTVTRDDLAHAIYARLPGLSRTDAKALLDCALEEILCAVARGEDVSLRRFGAFRVRSKNARPGRNPKTGVSVLVSPRRVVAFRAAPHLKLAVAPTRTVPAGDPS